MSRPKQAKAQLPPLDTGPLRLHPIRETARKDLIDIIDSRRGKKALILDSSVSSPLSLLDSSLSEILAEHGVVKLLHLEQKALDDTSYNQFDPKLSDIKNVLYVVRATVENTQMVASQIKGSLSKQNSHEFSIFFVPRRTIACEKVLEDAGVLADTIIGEFRLDLIPFDDDVLSLELDSAFKDCVLDGDTTPLFYVARSITELQRQFGLIPRIQGKGPAAESVKKILGHMRREHIAALTSQGASKIDRLILIDRDIDMATPMCTQITFEGLIDEITGIKCGSVPWQSNKDRRADGAESSSRATKGTLLLNSSDPFYKEFRDLPYYITSQRLQQYARDARKEYAELSSKDISDLKTFVKGLPKVMMLDRLSDVAVPVAEEVKQQLFHDKLRHEQDIIENYDLDASIEFIEELMCRGRDMMEVLRLLVLLSIANNGIQRRHYDTLRSHLLQTYGHHHLLTLNSLEKCGLLKAQTTGRGVFATIRKAFRLMVSDEEQPSTGAAPTDVAHLYKGYAPLSIRMVEVALKGTWSSVSEAMYLLPGGHFDVVQSVDENGLPVERAVKPTPGGVAQQQQAGAAGAGGEDGNGTKPEVVLVVFIGGCTFTEISALRFLSTQPEINSRFVVLTTKIVSGASMLRTFVDTATRNLEAAPQR